MKSGVIPNDCGINGLVNIPYQKSFIIYRGRFQVLQKIFEEQGIDPHELEHETPEVRILIVAIALKDAVLENVQA